MVRAYREHLRALQVKRHAMRAFSRTSASALLRHEDALAWRRCRHLAHSTQRRVPSLCRSRRTLLRPGGGPALFLRRLSSRSRCGTWRTPTSLCVPRGHWPRSMKLPCGLLGASSLCPCHAGAGLRWLSERRQFLSRPAPESLRLAARSASGLLRSTPQALGLGHGLNWAPGALDLNGSRLRLMRLSHWRGPSISRGSRCRWRCKPGGWAGGAAASSVFLSGAALDCGPGEDTCCAVSGFAHGHHGETESSLPPEANMSGRCSASGDTPCLTSAPPRCTLRSPAMASYTVHGSRDHHSAVSGGTVIWQPSLEPSQLSICSQI